MRKLHRTAGIALALAFSTGVVLPASAASPSDEPAWEEVEAPKEITTPKGIGVVNDEDIWAFGNGEEGKALSAHWDGKAWQTVPIPAFSELATFAARSDDDAWVGGRDFDSGTKFLAHWDGEKWTAVDPFESGERGDDHESMVNDITFLGDDVWVGGGCCGKPGWLTRWDGQQWHEAKLPTGEAQQDILYPEGLVATKSGELVTAGTRSGGGSYSSSLLRGTKDGFERQQAPEGAQQDMLWRAETLDGETLHAAGYTANDAGKYQPVFYRWDGSKWSKDEVRSEDECFINSMARTGNSLYASSEAKRADKGCTFRLSTETSQWEEIPAHGLTANGFNPGLVIGGSTNSDALWAFGSDGEGTHVKQYRP